MALQWLSLIATIWLQFINGTNSDFPAYSSELKRLMSLSQLQLNNLASASDAGKLLGWISGVAAARSPLWLVLLVGSLLGLVGYGVQFLFLAGRLPSSLSYYHVFALTVLAGNSICWINTVCYLVVIRDFPLDRQIAVGLSTSYVGLSAKIYTVVVDAVAPASSASGAERARVFLLLNSVLPLAVCVVAAPLSCRDVVGGVVRSRKLERGFFSMFGITVVTGLFGVVTSLGKEKLVIFHDDHSYRVMVFVVMFVLLLMPLMVPCGERIWEGVQQKCLIRIHDDDPRGDDHEGSTSIDKMEGGDQAKDRLDLVAVDREEIGPMLMLRRVEFWLYFCVYLFGATLGLVYLNNLGQIAESRGCSETSCSLVSLSSAFGFFGRLLPSLLDYFYPKSKSLISGPLAMALVMISMCGAFFLLMNSHSISLYVGTAVIGISTGAITSISVSTTAQLFGTTNFGVNHNIVVASIPVGSFLFGDFAALLYKRGRSYDDRGDDCVGQKCYQVTFVIWGCLCVLGTLLAFVLHARTKKLYARNRL